jgi:nucleolar MIF4G domain-containing protein 1
MISKRCTENTVDTVNVSSDILDHFAHLPLDVTASITSFVIESISAHSALLDSYVILHAALISSLHRLVGVEFGRDTLFVRCCDQLSLRAAFFVQNAVSSYEHQYSVLSSPTAAAHDATSDPIGKECSNLIVLLSELYNFQVISCVLLYDIIRNLLSAELSEFVVELLLKLLRSMC